MFVVEESQASLTLGEACFINQPYEILVRETRGGQTRELKRGQAPGRCGGSLLPLFAGFGDAAR
jgi:hypothetical protein